MLTVLKLVAWGLLWFYIGAGITNLILQAAG